MEVSKTLIKRNFSTFRNPRISAKINVFFRGNALICTHILKILVLEQMKWTQTSFPLTFYFVFVFKEIHFKKTKEILKVFPHSDTLYSSGVTKVTWGYINLSDWLVIQLTSKQDRTFALICWFYKVIVWFVVLLFFIDIWLCIWLYVVLCRCVLVWSLPI